MGLGLTAQDVWPRPYSPVPGPQQAFGVTGETTHGVAVL